MSARDAVQFAINHNLQVVNLNGFEDLTLADLNYLATSMPNLKELMFDNLRVKLLPVGLVKLAHLEISMDNVTGNGIEHCRQMRSVQNLEGFRFPASLQTIRLSNLDILENPDLKEMFDGKKLTGITFNLIRNCTDEIFQTLSSFDALETLSFRICPGIEGKKLALLKHLKRLESLTLADLGDFCVESIQAIGSLEGLKFLELADLPFLETDLAEIRGLQKLE